MFRHALRLGSILGLALAATPLIPHVASLQAAIAFDQVGPTSNTALATRSWSHFLGAGSGNNRIVILTLTTEDLTSSDQVATSVTFNGVAMTAVSGGSATNSANKVELYYLLDAALPASAGNYTVSVTFAGTVSELTLGTISLTGAKQAAPEAVATGTASATNTISTNITTTSANAWLIASIGLGDANTLTAGGSGNERYELISASSSGALSTTATTTAGTTAVSWTASASTNRLVQVVAAIAPAATSVTLSGNIFEDVTYAGGVGRSKAASSGVNRSGARVELFDGSGNYVSATTTDASGNYAFSVTPSANYTVRVVNSTVTSSLGGTSLLPVQTYRTTATSGSAVAVTDRVGGEDPAKADSGNGSTTLAALNAGSLTPQSITSVTVATSDISGLNFGFNFSTIVNTADSGQGSLRQFITNANGMSGTQTSVFMISGGSAVAGLRAGLTNQLTSGVAVITPATALPQITDTLTLDGTSQTTNVGNTNPGTLGAGGTVGVSALTLSTVNRPEVEISVPTSVGTGLNIAAGSTRISGIAIHGSGTDYANASIYVTSGSGVTISGNLIGTTATSFTLPGTNPNSAHNINIASASSGTISNNLIGYSGIHGVNLQTTSSGWTISNNEIRGCGTTGSEYGGVDVLGSSHTISGNLIIASKAQAVDIWQDGNNGHTVVNNTVSGNGVGVTGIREISGIDIVSDNNTVDRNIITGNFGSGVTIGSTGSGNRITRNSIYANGSITNDGAAAATGAIGIDLLAAGDDQNLGTAPYNTINDSGDGDSGGNTLLNFAVLDTARISGSNLVLTGWSAAGSVIELFIADSDASGFGEGQTYLTTLTEGSGSDTDATTSAYGNPVNGLNQGTNTTNRFSFTFALPGGVSAGTKLTATSTDGSNNTSEFSGVVTVANSTVALSGNIFEDVTYAGGVGRSKAASSGVNRSGARVELFDGSGNYVSATTTDASGNYSFSVTPSANYTVRVVNSTVTSSLGGTSLLPVQTYRTTATSGSAVAVTDRVGGEDPAKADSGNGSTTLAALTAGSLTPQSITSVTVATSDISGLDFGFNFSTIVNTADSGQGSLRQFITNANGMSGTQTSVFMISGGSAVAGLRAGLTSQLTSGVALITSSTALPQITGTLTLDGTSQTTNVGNTNPGTLGTGGTVGVDGVALSTVNRPEVEIIGTSSLATGLDINAAGTTVQGIAIHGHGASVSQGDIFVRAVSGVTISGCVIGTKATSFSLPASNATSGSGVVLSGSTNGTITGSLVGYTGQSGIRCDTTACSGWTISGNEVRGVATSDTQRDAVTLRGTGHAVSGNLLAGNKGNGIESVGAVATTTITNNTISASGVGTAGTVQIAGVRLTGVGVTVDRNIISGNYGAGVSVLSDGSGIRITRNSITGNGTITNDASAAATGSIGIDLLSAGDNQLLGTAPYVTLNDSGDGDSGGNALINTPVIETATIVGANLELTGWVASGATVEFFVCDQHASGFGSGATFIGSFTEGGGGDLDATTGSYSGTVNCFAQGADTNVARFHFVTAKPGSVSVGTKLTATATSTTNNTSEFCGNTAVISNLPSYSAVKTSQTISDPVNATTNPKAIPGGVAQYAIAITNSNPAVSDADSLILTDAIPASTELYVGNLAGAGSGPVEFVDGSVSSDLTYTFTSLASTTDDLAFSNDSGATWTYVPTPDADGFDAAVTNIRINPKGSFAKAACGDTPSCTFRFRVRVR